ncbi:MAG: DNA methyltransferase [Oscillatoriales cyanobacterium]|nr:MAG: DNA methyltransferase [Oscillatoriales cyanobacterium]
MAAFGQAVTNKLANPVASGQPEDQLRAPFEKLLADLAELAGLPRNDVIAIGESAIGDLKTRPDYSITLRRVLVGFIGLKAPGKGADPRKFKDRHDKVQWEKLKALPNLIYSDGNSFSLWRDGELVGSIVSCTGNIATAGKQLTAPAGLLDLFRQFFLWQAVAPRNAKELAAISARLCRLLRDEVVEQLALGSEALTALAEDWRKLLFPDATDEKFADGYAQAVTFGLLMARASGIELGQGLDRVAIALKANHSLIGVALRLLTETSENQATLKTSLRSLSQVLDAVDWPTISKGDPETWLYFYEDFLEVYDNELRKQTGSYYTPPVVVETMVRLVDDLLRSPDFGLHSGLAAPSVTVIDPATGTGTYMLGILKKIAESVRKNEGEGAVPQAINAALKRLIAFEVQLGPFAVAQLRILAEIITLTGDSPIESLRMFVADTLADPEDDAGWIPQLLAPIAQSRKAANQIKRTEPITVVIGNPPYKEKAKGRGGWVESGNSQTGTVAPLNDWQPPKNWGVSAHAKHLRNLYVYFWRWATWKVFDHHPDNSTGIVCFITVSGFLNGPGFQRMRQYLREECDRIWVIDCSPEGHQPEVNTRLFQGVQQPVCIVLGSRSKRQKSDELATVKFRSLPAGLRDQKFAELRQITLDGPGWLDCPLDTDCSQSGSRSPFAPGSTGAWLTYPCLQDFFNYNGSGVMPGRTWVIAPDAESLSQRWQTLIKSPDAVKDQLFYPHGTGDRHVSKVLKNSLPGYPQRLLAVVNDSNPVVPPVGYAYRSFDRQWIIPDNRLINRPNPKLWEWHSEHQIYLTALLDNKQISGPAYTFSSLIPDLHHYKGSFGGRVFPLWADAEAQVSNLNFELLDCLSHTYEQPVSPEFLLAYMAAIAAHSGFTTHFQADLKTPGIRIPLTANPDLFAEAVAIGQRVLWLHTFGDRCADPSQGRPPGPPRLPSDRRPTIPKGGAIPADPDRMPDTISHDPSRDRLQVGDGYIDNVPAAVWNYEVSGKPVIWHWFSYRKRDRSRPVLGDRRPPSALSDIQPDRWLADYTTELLNLLNVLGWLVELEPQQAELLDRICRGATLSRQHLMAANALTETVVKSKSTASPGQLPLL